jgi:hypothetical protein
MSTIEPSILGVMSSYFGGLKNWVNDYMYYLCKNSMVEKKYFLLEVKSCSLANTSGY